MIIIIDNLTSIVKKMQNNEPLCSDRSSTIDVSSISSLTVSWFSLSSLKNRSIASSYFKRFHQTNIQQIICLFRIGLIFLIQSIVYGVYTCHYEVCSGYIFRQKAYQVLSGHLQFSLKSYDMFRLSKSQFLYLFS